MKKRNFILLFVLFLSLFQRLMAYADVSPISNSIRNFGLSSDELYILGVSAIKDNKFEIVESQADNGLVLFKSGENLYMMSISNNIMKILPKYSDFSSGFSVQDKIFKNIDGKIRL